MWFNPASWGNNERKVELGKTHSADDRLPKIVFLDQPSSSKRKRGCPRIGWEDFVRNDVNEKETSLEGVKREPLNMC